MNHLLDRTDRKEHYLPVHKSYRAIEISMRIQIDTNISSPLHRCLKLRQFPELTKILSRSNSKRWRNQKPNINLREERPSHREKFPQLDLRYPLAGNNKGMHLKLVMAVTRIMQPMKMNWIIRLYLQQLKKEGLRKVTMIIISPLKSIKHPKMTCHLAPPVVGTLIPLPIKSM
jgi:hypothetical protein